MKCPGNAKHTGIKVELKNTGSARRYAKVVCAVCDLWLRWMRREEYIEYLWSKGERFGLDETLSEGLGDHIREIARDEIKKMEDAK